MPLVGVDPDKPNEKKEIAMFLDGDKKAHSDLSFLGRLIKQIYNAKVAQDRKTCCWLAV